MTFRSTDRLAEILANAWTAETSNNPGEWSKKNPAFGQCAVTALVMQHYFGGDILRVDVTDTAKTPLGSHYFNRLPSGVTLDLTLQQFPIGISLHAVERRAPKDLLDPAVNPKNTETARRFGILMSNVRLSSIDYETRMGA